MTETTLRKVKPAAYGVEAPLFISLEFTGDSATSNNGATNTALASRLYDAGGHLLSTRGTVAFTGQPFYPVAIQSDPLGNVGDGSWCFRGNASTAGGTREIYVWDVLGGELHLFNPANVGYLRSGVAYYNGRLYFWETQTGSTTNPAKFRLYSMLCDTSGVTLIGEMDVSPASFNRWAGTESNNPIILTKTHALISQWYERVDLSGHTITARMPLAGPPGTTQDAHSPLAAAIEGAPAGGAPGLPPGVGSGAVGRAVVDFGPVYRFGSHTGAVNATFSPVWPAGGAWDVGHSILRSWFVTPDGQRGMAFVSPGASPDHRVIVARTDDIASLATYEPLVDVPWGTPALMLGA